MDENEADAAVAKKSSGETRRRLPGSVPGDLHVALSLRSLPFHAPSRPLVRCEGFLPTQRVWHGSRQSSCVSGEGVKSALRRLRSARQAAQSHGLRLPDVFGVDPEAQLVGCCKVTQQGTVVPTITSSAVPSTGILFPFQPPYRHRKAVDLSHLAPPPRLEPSVSPLQLHTTHR
ncbi:hypothetical protein L1887_53531 [Cichorium endivia]|nr:hypothetical protein L1887_53531 [Cichorium endivia]